MSRGMLERLRHRVDVYEKEKKESVTIFSEVTYKYRKTGTVWAEIVPVGRGTGEIQMPGESIRADVTHKVTMRRGAVTSPKNDMYFEYGGQRFDIMYFMPNYKYNDVVEFYCKLHIEGDCDYGE